MTTPVTGNPSPDEQIAGRLVEDPDAQFNGELVSMRVADRWLICAREVEDDTLLPFDSTRQRPEPGP